MHSIDLNADLGEGFGAYRLGADGALIPLLTSANVACGFHAGDPVVMRETVAAAVRHGVVVGAHPGYPDLMGFGRRDLGATAAEITAYVIYQIGALDAVCRAAGTRLRYVKAHGALYNRAATDRVAADAIAEAIRLSDSSLVMLGLAGSQLIAAGEAAGLGTAAEAFADRAYTREGTLVARSVAGAVIHDTGAVVARALRMVTAGAVTAIDGTDIAICADSLCVHGDTPGAVELVRALRTHFDEHGVRVASFAP
jgi:5-oxoprolinase (ATP-hydrolysing) subunit A